jgi:predicted HTH transcriptional regulator
MDGTGANRNTVKKHLENLVAANHLKKEGVGNETWYSMLAQQTALKAKSK